MIVSKQVMFPTGCQKVGQSLYGKVPERVKSIAYLNLLWKLLAGIIKEKVYDHLNKLNLLPEEQNNCRRKTRGTKD